MPKVSVCIPSYNHGKYIGGCIESVLAQTFPNWEAIIVDNCSSDNTEEVVGSFFPSERMQFHKNETNIGAVRNWNRCASFARGEYLAFLQSDDQYLPRMLERSVAMLDAHPRLGFVHSSFHRIDSDGKFIDTKRRGNTDLVMDGRTALRQLLQGCYITPSAVLMRKSLFNELGGFDERYSYSIDWSMWMRIALSADIGYIAEPLVLQRPGHAASLTTSTVMRHPHLSTSEEIRLIGEIRNALPPDGEWRELFAQAYRNVMHRHIAKSLCLLHRDNLDAFRTAIANAIRLNHRFPVQYRKIMVLWAASTLGGDFARWLDFEEQAFWQTFWGAEGKPSIVVP